MKNKFKIFSAVLVLSFVSFLFVPFISRGVDKPVNQMTQTEIKAKIAEIVNLIKQLQTLLDQIRGGSLSTLSQIPKGYTFSNNLREGDLSIEVKYLQIFLNSDQATKISDSGSGSPGNETNYFGAKTRIALSQLQTKYYSSILASRGLTKATGYFDSYTRDKVNNLLSQYRLSSAGTGTETGSGTSAATTAIVASVICGNNKKESGETCDGVDLGSYGNGQAKCTLYSPSYESGNLSCSSDCKTIITSSCVLATPATPTLDVDLKVSTNSSNWDNSISGTSPLVGVDLKASISGTATGTISYSFDCTNDGAWDSPDTTEYKGILTLSKEFANGCSYSASGTYTARVRVERNTAPIAYDTVNIIVNEASQSVPTPYCGDNSCNNAENCSTCSQDCGTCPVQLLGTVVSAASASGASGATNIAVPITVSGLGISKIYGIDVVLTYDSNLITATAVQKGNATSNWNLVSNISTAGQAKIALYYTGELPSAGGEIAKIIFSAKSGVSTGSKSNLTLTKADLNEVSANNKVNGEFTISQ